MSDKNIPDVFGQLLSDNYIEKSHIIRTSDGFFMVYKSLADILAEKNILDFPDTAGERLLCSLFFDDWFLYAVADGNDYIYSLLKMREQEHDAEYGSPADGDSPGVTISFISFECDILMKCLADSSDDNRKKLNTEINRVVAFKRQRHNPVLKRYFKNPHSLAPYLVADLYIRHIASFSEKGYLEAPLCYKELVQQSISYKNLSKAARLPDFIKKLNEKAGYVICDNEKIYIKNKEKLTEYECLAILATHTGNTSVYSFAAEVEYHAKFLTPLAKIRIPFFRKTVYDSAIRADMTADTSKFEGPAPFYQSESKIVKRQYMLHSDTSDPN